MEHERGKGVASMVPCDMVGQYIYKCLSSYRGLNDRGERMGPTYGERVSDAVCHVVNIGPTSSPTLFITPCFSPFPIIYTIT